MSGRAGGRRKSSLLEQQRSLKRQRAGVPAAPAKRKQPSPLHVSSHFHSPTNHKPHAPRPVWSRRRYFMSKSQKATSPPKPVQGRRMRNAVGRSLRWRLRVPPEESRRPWAKAATIRMKPSSLRSLIVCVGRVEWMECVGDTDGGSHRVRKRNRREPGRTGLPGQSTLPAR